MTAFNPGRRSALAALSAVALSALLPNRAGASALIRPRSRVILDNDFAGDPDGLFQAAHHLLSPSADVRTIVGSHLHAAEAFVPKGNQAADSATRARELLSVMGVSGHLVPASATGAVGI